MGAFKKTQQFKPLLIKAEDKEELEEGLLYFIMLRNIWHKIQASFPREDLFLLEEINKDLQEIYEKNPQKIEGGETLIIALPIKLKSGVERLNRIFSRAQEDYSSKFPNITYPPSLELTKTSKELFLCLEYNKKFVCYELSLKLRDLGKEGLTNFGLEDPALSLLWLAWAKEGKLQGFPEKRGRIGISEFSGISRAFEQILEYTDRLGENLKIKASVLSFSVFEQEFVELKENFSEILEFSLETSQEYSEYFRRNKGLSNEKPKEFGARNKKLEAKKDFLLTQILSKKKVFSLSKVGRGCCKSDFGLYFTSKLPLAYSQRVDPFLDRNGITTLETNDTYQLYYELVFRDQEKEREAKIRIIAGKGGGIYQIGTLAEAEKNTEKAVLFAPEEEAEEEAREKKKEKIAFPQAWVGEMENATSKAAIKEFWRKNGKKRLEIKKKNINSAFKFTPYSISDEDFPCNLFLDGNPLAAGDDPLKINEFSQWPDVIVNAWTPAEERLNLDRETTLFISFGNLKKLEQKEIKTEGYCKNEEEEEAEEETIYNLKAEYAEAEFLFYLLLNFLFKFSRILSNNNESGLKEEKLKAKAFLLELETEIKTLLEVYNFTGAIAKMSEQYELVKLL